MGRQILTTLMWTAILFVLCAVFSYFTKGGEWLAKTLEWVIPSAVGFFLGYGQAKRNKNEK